MSINLKEALSPDTFDALVALSDRMEWAEIRVWQEPVDVAWLTVQLEFVEDNPENFPRGKWATIQRLQDVVREVARRLAAVRQTTEGQK